MEKFWKGVAIGVILAAQVCAMYVLIRFGW